MTLATEREERDLRTAVSLLEFPTFADQLSGWAGRPIEKAIGALPARVSGKMGDMTMACVRQAFRVILLTVDDTKPGKRSRDGIHKAIVAATGAAGGFFGGLATVAELPVSTGIMMRSVADIARSEGERLGDIEARLACLQVLALDTTRREEAPVEVARYLELRAMMTAAVEEAAAHIAKKGLADPGAPALVRLMIQIAERFSIPLTEKAAADFVPVIGSVTGSGINLLFISHFQRLARGHFIVRRLERLYGADRIRTEYAATLHEIRSERERGRIRTRPSRGAGCLCEDLALRQHT
jgi:hypothetical protein